MIDQVGHSGIVLGAEDHLQNRKMTLTADMLIFVRNVLVLIERQRKSGEVVPRLRCASEKDTDPSSDMNLVQRGGGIHLLLSLTIVSLNHSLALPQNIQVAVKDKTMVMLKKGRWVIFHEEIWNKCLLLGENEYSANDLKS